MITDDLDKYDKWKSEEPKIECYNSSTHRISYRLSSGEAIITKKSQNSLDSGGNFYLPIAELGRMKKYLDKMFENPKKLKLDELHQEFRDSIGFTGDIQNLVMVISLILIYARTVLTILKSCLKIMDLIPGLRVIITDLKEGQVKSEPCVSCVTPVSIPKLEYKYFLYFNSSTITGKRGEGNIIYDSCRKIANQEDVLNAQKHIEKILYNIQGVAVKPGSVTIKNITLLDG